MQILQCYWISKKGCIKNIKYIMLKLSSSHITSTTSNSDQNIIEYNSTISSNSIKLNQQQSYHVQHVLIYLQSAINITNLIILIVHQISCIFSQYVQYFSWWCAWHSMACNDSHCQFCYQCQHIRRDTSFFQTCNQFQQFSSKHCIDLMKLLHMTVEQSNVNNNVLFHLPSHKKDIYKLLIGGKHSIQTNLPVPTTFNIAITACISPDAYIDHVLGLGIPIKFAHDSTTGPNFAGLHGSEQCWRVVNSILAMHLILPTHLSWWVTYGQMDFWGVILGKRITQYGPRLSHSVCYLSMLHQNTTLVCWHLDGARMITNLYLTMSQRGIKIAHTKALFL